MKSTFKKVSMIFKNRLLYCDILIKYFLILSQVKLIIYKFEVVLSNCYLFKAFSW